MAKIKLYPTEGYGVHMRSIEQMNDDLFELTESAIPEQYWKYNPDTNQLETPLTIQTGLNSVKLGDQHEISSSADDIAFTNLDNSDESYIAAAKLKDHKLPINRTAAGVLRASSKDFGELLDDGSGGFEPRGPEAASGAVPFVLDTTLVPSLSIYEVQVIAMEDIDPEDTMHYSISAGTSMDDRTIYEQELTGVSVSAGAVFAWDFDKNSNIQAGSVLHIEMRIDKGSTGENIRPLIVRPSANQPTEIYAKVLGRAFETKELAYKSEVDAIISGAEYKGSYDASTNTPDLTGSSFNSGVWYRASVAGTQSLTGGTFDFEVGDFIVWNGTAWDYYPMNSVTINQLENASLSKFDITVDADYSGATQTGTSLFPFTTIDQAISNAVDGSTILVKGTHVITSPLVIPSNKGLHFFGENGATIGYASYAETNGSVISIDAVDNSKQYSFTNLTIVNAGAYGIHTKNTAKVTVEDCILSNNGWDGTGLNTVAPSAISGVLGYDSTAAELQAFYAGSSASDGGALRIENSTYVEVIGNTVQKNLRGIRVQDCGINGAGFITRNISSQNVESGIYLAAGSLGGCQNVIVTINSSAFNANNGLLCIGGINNKFSQNEVNGNWNAGFCAWGAANTTLRDCGLYNNNRSSFNGIGNTGDAKASIQINEAYDLLGTQISLNPAARFIAEILDTQVHYTGLGSNTDKVGFLITEDVGLLDDDAKNIIKVDDVGFIGQDYAVDFSEVDLTNLRVSLGDNSYQSIGVKAIKAPLDGSYFELPFSNHSMQFPAVDFNVSNTGNVEITEGVGGNLINPYSVNELQALAYKSDIKVVLKGTNKIQFIVPVSGASINGSSVSTVQATAVTQLNDLFTNTAGFSSGGNPVTAFALAGNNLTLTLQDTTEYVVDVTTLGVDENKFVTSGAISEDDLVLTMNDASEITIDIAGIVNGNTPSLAPDISNQSFDVTKDQAFNVQIALDTGSDIVTQYGEMDAPSWALLNQATGTFNGTAPSTTGTHVINCKAGNPLGGSVSFTVTLNVIEPVYTNTKSLKFVDGSSSYLGGNAALVTALERSGNGSGASDAFSIGFWMKGSTSNQGQTLFYFGANDVTNNGYVEIKQTNYNGAKRLRIRYGSNNNYVALTTPNGSITPSDWQYVFLTYDGGTTGSSSGSMNSYYSRFKVYIDGVLQSTHNTHSNYGYSGSIVGQNYRFGRFSSGNYLRGVLLNQLAIWGSDQSSNVSGLYNGGNTQDISLLQASTGNMNSGYVAPDHYYEIENSVSTIQDLIGTAHFVGYNFASSSLVDDAP